MFFKRIALVIVIAMLMYGCEIMPYSEYGLPEYDGELEWTEVVRNAEWKNRFDHAAVVFDNNIWIVGGYNPGEFFDDTYYEDVWKSADGEKWELVNANAPWLGRRGHQLVNFNDGKGEALFLIGGFSVNEESGYRQYNNDVWKSTDGENWTEIKSTTFPDIEGLSQAEVDSVAGLDWYPRNDHQCVVFNVDGRDYIYLIGGFTMQDGMNGRYGSKYFNDVWRTSNGVKWERVDNNDFGIRSEHAVAVNPINGKIYIQGGIYGLKFETGYNQKHVIEHFQGVWSSDDGKNWDVEVDSLFNQNYFWRSDHEMVFYKDKLWGLLGKTTSEEHYHFTYSTQIAIWNIDTQNVPQIDGEGEAVDARHGYASVVFNDKIWIFGGFTNRYGQANDVWCGELLQ